MVAALQNRDDAQSGPFVADEIETSRLRLRMFAPEDLDELCVLASDPEVMRFIGRGLPLTREETHFNLTSIINAFRRRGFGRWALVKKETGTLVGYCGLAHGSEEVGVEIAYMLSRSEWGKGLATEAARACLHYAFERLKFDSIAALTRPENHRSRRVMERLGMRFVRAGQYYGYSCVCYSIARADWHPDGSVYRVIR
jgi:RimJ/RimL family protein N-acetyltransferase